MQQQDFCVTVCANEPSFAASAHTTACRLLSPTSSTPQMTLPSIWSRTVYTWAPCVSNSTYVCTLGLEGCGMDRRWAKEFRKQPVARSFRACEATHPPSTYLFLACFPRQAGKTGCGSGSLFGKGVATDDNLSPAHFLHARLRYASSF